MRTQEDLLRAISTAKLRRSADHAHAYRQLQTDARANFPGDAVAQYRAVEAAASRALRVTESVSSADEIQNTMDEALQEAFPGRDFSWVETQINPPHVIARGSDGKLYAIAHAMADGGGVTWYEPKELSGQLDSHAALLDHFDGGSAFSPVEAQPPHVIAKGRDGKLYSFGHSVSGGVVTWDEPQEFLGQLQSQGAG